MLAKRLFDLVVTVPAVIVLLPVLSLLALWVKLDSPGPVLFLQERIGRNGVPFKILKCRTMCTDAEKNGLRITVGKDPRITRCGHFLRALKLDELPQLINVIRGEMSLVGPRPEVAEYIDCYTDEEREKVLSVPPGITDYASIEFRRENELLAVAEDPRKVYIEEVLPAKIGYHMAYVEDRSLRGDISILIKTLVAIFR